MGLRTVPVIGTNPITGAKIRYPSVKAAAEASGVNTGQLYKSIVMGYKCGGMTWNREDDWRLSK